MPAQTLVDARGLPAGEAAAATQRRAARPRVCIVSANLPPLYTGGGQQAVTLGQAIAALGHEVLFVTQQHRDLPRQDRIGDLDVERVDYDASRFPGMWRTIRQVARLGRRLLALRGRFDVVLFFNPEGGFHNSWVLIPLLHLFGKSTATRMTLLDANDPAALRRKRFAWFRLMPYRLHHRVISISSALSSSFQSVFGSDRRLVYIPNGVVLDRFVPVQPEERRALRRSLGLDADLRYCTFVGRISQRKGIDILIDAWPHVMARHPGVRLVLVGPTSDEFRAALNDDFVERIRDVIRRNGLESSIIWVGRTEEPERYLQASDLFVFPSRREGCPNALLEAMACALPIVSTRIEGITEDLITPGVHGVVTPSDAGAFAHGIDALLSDPARARDMGARAHVRALEEFGIQTTARRYLDVLRQL
jgi:glycosyltransferase involved in cell wall biosynthesis